MKGSKRQGKLVICWVSLCLFLLIDRFFNHKLNVVQTQPIHTTNVILWLAADVPLFHVSLNEKERKKLIRCFNSQQHHVIMLLSKLSLHWTANQSLAIIGNLLLRKWNKSTPYLALFLLSVVSLVSALVGGQTASRGK